MHIHVGVEQTRIQSRVGAKVDRVQVLVDWSHEAQERSKPSFLKYS